MTRSTNIISPQNQNINATLQSSFMSEVSFKSEIENPETSESNEEISKNELSYNQSIIP
jgi:hypothetical protein